jgi:TonB family protein
MRWMSLWVAVLASTAAHGQSPSSANPYRFSMAPSRPPTVIYKVDPTYTQEALNAKREGIVVVSLAVRRNGVAADLRVTRRLGFGLDDKALQAVRKWRFAPGDTDGQRVAVEVTFRLPVKPAAEPPDERAAEDRDEPKN